MEDTKKWYLSRGVWGGIIATISGIAGIAGHSVNIEQQTQIVNTIMILAPFGASTMGGLVALYGRLKANHKLN